MKADENADCAVLCLATETLGLIKLPEYAVRLKPDQILEKKKSSWRSFLLSGSPYFVSTTS